MRIEQPKDTRWEKSMNHETGDISFRLQFRNEQAFKDWIAELEQASFDAGVQSVLKGGTVKSVDLPKVVEYKPISGHHSAELLHKFGIPVNGLDHRDYSINGIILNLASRVARLEAQLGLQSAEP